MTGSKVITGPAVRTGRPWPARFAGQSSVPLQPGARLVARSGMRAVGLLPSEQRDGLSVRWVGPEPEATIGLGVLAPEIKRVRLTFLAPDDRAEIGPVSLLLDGTPLVVQSTDATPGGATWSLEAALPERPDGSRPARLQLRLARTRPDPGTGSRWVGLALHAIDLLAGTAVGQN